MNLTNHALILDFVEWVALQQRPYDEVMEAWRTSCPRLTIWEDAVDAGLVVRRYEAGAGSFVTATSSGLALLEREGRLPEAAIGSLSRRAV